MKKRNPRDKGISKRKDGRYSARFVDKNGIRQEQYFKSIPEARNWLEKARYEDKHGISNISADMTVDEWFDIWLESVSEALEDNTIKNYVDRYTINVKPIIGKIKLDNVKPIHCQKIINQMEKDEYAPSTIGQTYTTMGTLFKAAIANGYISKHPLDTVRLKKSVNHKKDIIFLTVEEQEAFLNEAKNHRKYEQYVFLLETGLRIGEMIALSFDCVDLEKRTITIEKSMEYKYSRGKWKAGPPKTMESYRTLPLTDTAYSILEKIYNSKDTRKMSEELDQTLYYKDKRTDETKSFNMKELVFLNWRTGMPTKTSSYDTYLNKLTDLAKIKHISAHSLRHTYATRAIERGVQPKVLQKLLGHKSITTTMDTYVHVSDDSMLNAIQQYQKNSNGVKMVSNTI